MLSDKAIRYCCVVDRLGNIVEQQTRQGLDPILAEKDRQQRALAYAIADFRRRSWEEKLGELQYLVAKYKRLITAQIPLDKKHILIVSFDPDTKNFDSVLSDTVIPLFGSSTA